MNWRWKAEIATKAAVHSALGTRCKCGRDCLGNGFVVANDAYAERCANRDVKDATERADRALTKLEDCRARKSDIKVAKKKNGKVG